jgi:hypothetical protein
MGYDALIARGQRRREDIDRFAPERREAYEAFVRNLRREREYWKQLQELAQCHRRSENVPQAVMNDFPKSPMGDLVESLGAVRRVARTYQVIAAAESIVHLFSDMATAERSAVSSPGPNDEITRFLLQRFLDDREHEFVQAYRQDLGLGAPDGAPRGYGQLNRPWSSAAAEATLRAHLPRKQGDARPTE